jgi:hypothetical protein
MQVFLLENIDYPPCCALDFSGFMSVFFIGFNNPVNLSRFSYYFF